MGLDGTETTLDATVSLWDFDLRLQLAPTEGNIDGEIYDLRTTWDETCAQAELTLNTVPFCTEVQSLLREI